MKNNYKVYMRDEFSDTGSIPSQAEMAYKSPDIIPVGTNPLNDSGQNKLINGEWDTDQGKTVEDGYPNYIYVRGASRINVTKPIEAQINLFYTKSSLLMNPGSWIGNQIPSSGGGVSFKATEDNQRLLGNEPFIWIPPSKEGRDHYCLVSQVVTEDMPNRIPNHIKSSGNFTHWVVNNPGIAWRNVIIEKNRVQPKIYAPQFENLDSEAEMYGFLGTATNYPIGTKISFVCQAQGVTPSINYDQKVDSDKNPTNIFTSANVAALSQAALIVTIVPPKDKNGQPISIPGNATFTTKFFRMQSGGQFSVDKENDELLRRYSKTGAQHGIDPSLDVPEMVQLGEVTVTY